MSGPFEAVAAVAGWLLAGFLVAMVGGAVLVLALDMAYGIFRRPK